MSMNYTDQELLRLCTRLLEPHMGDDLREVWVDQAFWDAADSRLHTQLDLKGSPLVCCNRLVKTLLLYGCLKPGQHALAELLQVVRDNRGLQIADQFNPVIMHLNDKCAGRPAPPTAPSAVSPPATPTQTVDTPLAQQSAAVFVSYSHDDADFARGLITALNAAGHACWIDNEKLKVGDRWSESIARGIRQSYAFLVVCTRHALESRYVKAEIRWAVDNDKLIIPLLLEDVTRDDAFFDLKPHQGVAFFNQPHAAAIRRLIAELPPPQIALPEGETPTLRPPTSRRAFELAYMDRLRFQDFQLERYTALGGDFQQAQRQMAAPAWVKQEFEHHPYMRGDERGMERETRRFEDAATELQTIKRAVVLG